LPGHALDRPTLGRPEFTLIDPRRLVVRPRITVATLVSLALLAGACSSGVPDPVAVTARPEEMQTDMSDEPSESDAPNEEPTTATVEAGEAPLIVRGIYSTVYSFWGDRWENLIRLVRETEVNAIVVDVKDEAGTLLWHIDHPLATLGGGAEWKSETDPQPRLDLLHEAGGWAIARVACFKDTLIADARPDLAVQNQSGDTWKARKDFSWLNPYQDEAGQWCIDVGLAALELGFDEVQFDYIRFPNGGDGDTSVIQLPGVPDDRPRDQWRHTEEITQFLTRASEQIHAVGGLLSADVFGLVTYDFSWDAQGTGQVVEQIAEVVDFISPMVYPSHYGPGNYGLKPHPVKFPYETVWNSMQEAQMRVQGLHAKIRPWLEDFQSPWLGYGDHSTTHVSEQLRATYENGIEGWLLWNAGNSYSEMILSVGEATSKADPDFVAPYRTADPNAAPGEIEKKWPGRPDCKPDREKLFIGKGNLAASTPPVRAPGVGEFIKCVQEKPDPATTPSPEASSSDEPVATDPSEPANDASSADDGA
jgi:hypothetical protein